jgi:hypothetical protein
MSTNFGFLCVDPET